MLIAAKGDFDSNPVLYVNMQLRKHCHFTRQELEEMTDEEWAEAYAILKDIRQEEAKNNQPFAT